MHNIILKTSFEVPKKVIMFSDEELVLAIFKTGDLNLFEELYDRYEKLIYNTCYSYTKAQPEAEDLTQDVFLKLYTNLTEFNNTSQFSMWLNDFVKNQCSNYLDRNDKIKFQSIRFQYCNVESFESLADEDVTTGIEVDLLTEPFISKVELLSSIEKDVLFLRYKHAMSISEISASTKMTKSTVIEHLNKLELACQTTMPLAV